MQDVEGGLLQKPRCNITATLGLVVHAAVDGIALGAAATTSHTEVEVIIFVAIMLHKVSFLHLTVAGENLNDSIMLFLMRVPPHSSKSHLRGTPLLHILPHHNYILSKHVLILGTSCVCPSYIFTSRRIR